VFLETIIRWNGDRSTASVEIPYEYLLVVAHKAHD
jgi:hypothetical protein